MAAIVVVFVAFAVGSFFQTVAGFGSALIIMPLLTLYIGVKTATTVMAVAGAAVTVTVLYQNRRGLRWREAGRLLTGSVIGVPIGTWALKVLPGPYVVAFLGVILIAYSMFAMISARGTAAPAVEPASQPPTLRGRIVTSLVGFCAGFLCGAYAADGPPLVVYGAVKRWPKESFRSILQACFLVDGLLLLVCHKAGGLVTGEVLTFSLYGIPGMIMGLVAGSLLDRKINHKIFQKLLVTMILFFGIALIARAAFMP